MFNLRFSQVKEAEAIEGQMRAKGPGGAQPPQPGQQPQYPGDNLEIIETFWLISILDMNMTVHFDCSLTILYLLRGRPASVWRSPGWRRLSTSATGLLSTPASTTPAGSRISI